MSFKLNNTNHSQQVLTSPPNINRIRTITLSTKADIPALLSLADDARRTMRESGNLHQWSDGYPSADIFLQDIQRGVSYIVRDDGIATGTFAFIPSPEPTYQKIYQGTWINDTHPYHVIHRIAASRSSHGIFASMLQFCLSHTNNIRIDTHRDNTIMQHLLIKNNFQYCGIIYLSNGDERLAYQRIDTVNKDT
jgi:hypothetical protein